MKKILTLMLVAFTAITVVSCKKEPAPAKLVGDVSYRDRQIEGVEVTLSGEGATYTFTTITNGYFYFENLPAGDYIISCRYNNKSVASFLRNFEKSDNPSKVTVVEGGLHTRNVVIPEEEDMGMDDDDDEGDE